MRPRPSSLELSLHCQRAPWLSERHHETSEAARKGSSVDAEVSSALAAENESLLHSPEAKHCYHWLQEFAASVGGCTVTVQGKAGLCDPESLELLTEGTPDVALMCPGKSAVYIIDWKKADQWRAGLLPPIDSNPQLLAYLAAWMLRAGAKLGKVCVVPWDEEGVYPQWSKDFTDQDVMGIIDMVRSAPEIDPTGPEPEASKGDHCKRCYQKHHCSAYLLPTYDGMVQALVPLTVPEILTNESALAALEWVEEAKRKLGEAKKLVEIVEDRLETHTATVAPIVGADGKTWGLIPTKGKRSGPTVAECEKAGLAHLIHDAKPGTKYDWRK